MQYKLDLNESKYQVLTILLIVIIFITLIIKHIDLRNSRKFDKVISGDQWYQPSILNERFPQLIGKHDWGFEFNKVENIIRDLEFDADDKLIINHHTIEKLKLVLFELNEPLLDIQWNRIKFLMQKSLGDRNGKKFFNIVKKYYFYHKEHVRYKNIINRSNYNDKLTLFKKSHTKNLAMQEKYFGIDIAKKMFSRVNTTTNYLNARRIINMDNKLSNKKKKERLLSLSTSYKITISQW